MASIAAEHVWKQFLLAKDRADSVGQLLVRMLPGRNRRPPATRFWALQDVSFTMPEGTSLGIIGTNGSGKSTVLKLLTRTMQPTHGQIDVRGRLSALIELGAGFHPDFTGRENVILNASILGIGRREIERRMDDIIEFSEIRPFIDSPVKYYSSGMQARLGFAVAIHVSAELLIVDEVLSVGDVAFQQKCMERIFDLKRSGVGILLVSHDLGSIERLMDRAVWIEKGVLKADGAPHAVVHAYRAYLEGRDLSQGAGVSSGAADPSKEERTDRPVRLAAEVRVAGRRTNVVSTGASAELTLEWQNESGSTLVGQVSVLIRRGDGLVVADFSTMDDGASVSLPEGYAMLTLQLSECVLSDGAYEVDVTFTEATGRRLPEWNGLLRFQVRSAHPSQGIVRLPHRWRMPEESTSFGTTRPVP